MDIFISRDDDDHSAFSSTSLLPGNAAFGKAILQTIEEGYCDLENHEKTVVAFQVLQDWKRKGGRFLDNETKKELSDQKVRKKILRALRMQSSELQRNTLPNIPTKNGKISTIRRISTTLDYTKQGKLYGRDEEVRKLQGWREEVATTGQHRLIVLSGPSGAGKTALAHSLSNTEDIFLHVKFEQPFVDSYLMGPVLMTALDSLSGRLRDRPNPEERRKRYQSFLATEYNEDATSLPLLFPKLHSWLMETNDTNSQTDRLQHEDIASEFSNALKRQAFAATVFLRSVLSVELCSLVVLLDDIQWIDEASLDMLTTIWELLPPTPDLSCGILYVATDRNETSSFLRNGDPALPFATLDLPKLDRSAVADLLQSSFNVSTDEVGSLSDFIFHQTQGNAGFICELLRVFEEERILHDKDINWVCDDASARLVSSDTPSLLGLFSQRVQNLPQVELNVLQLASCLGSHLDVDVLTCLLGDDVASNEALASLIPEAIERRIIVWNSAKDSFRFAHDGIQQAIYDTMNRASQEATHMKIGRAIWKTVEQQNGGAYEQRIDVALSQILKVKHLLKGAKERTLVASLCLRAGEGAVRSIGFNTSAMYVNNAIELLGSKRWKENYELCLRLHNVAAEVSYVTGNFGRVQSLVSAVQENARSRRDSLQALSTLAYSLGSAGKYVETVELCRSVLRDLDEALPRRSTERLMRIELAQTQRLLRQKGTRNIALLPEMYDDEKRQAMTFLNLMVWATWSTDTTLLVLVLCRMVRLSIHHGLCPASAVGFSWYGFVLCRGGREIDEGYNICQIAFSILEQFPGDAWLARVTAAVYGCVSSWKDPLHVCSRPLKRSYHVGLGTGDIEFAMLNGCMYCWNHREALPLPTLDSEFNTLASRMKSFGLPVLVNLLSPCWQVVQNLRGGLEEPKLLRGPILNAAEVVASNPDPVVLGWVRFECTFLAVLFGDYALADQWSVGLEAMHRYMYGAMDASVLLFYHCLTLLLRWKKLSWRRQLQARAYMSTMRRWALRTPPNFLSKLLFLEAEWSRIRGNAQLASSKYQSAILHAKADGVVMQQALVHERLADLWLHDLKQPSNALSSLREASQLYGKWGALSKVAQVSQCISKLTGDDVSDWHPTQ